MKAKHIAIIIVVSLMLSGTLIATVNAQMLADSANAFSKKFQSGTWPKLPSTPVQLTVIDGTTSYFLSTLSGIHKRYDVYNGLYYGWCVDMSVVMARSVAHDVLLYCSLSPPSSLSSINWNAVNYILNHKQGTMMDIQNAIWYFTDNYTPDGGHSAASLAMIGDAESNPTYNPLPDGFLAIICLPLDPTNAQNSIIELNPPGTGKVTGGGQCIVGENIEIPSASFGFNAMWFSRNPIPNGELDYVDHTTGQHVHVHDLTYLEVWDDAPGNKPWPMLKAKFGGPDVYTGYDVDVYVEDAGEPGTSDKFLIFLDGAYLGGSGDYFGSTLVDDFILAGNIQIHKPPK